MKIKVIIPHYLPLEFGGISWQTLEGVKQLERCNENIFDVFFACSTCIENNRNLGITKKYDIWQKPEGYDYYLFIDADIKFCLHNVMQLLSSKLPIVGGAYSFKEHHLKDYLVALNNGSRITILENSIMKVDRIGAGFLLVRQDVFTKIQYPYFERYVLIKEDGTVEHLGEDWYFCDKCKLAGYDIWMDASLTPKLEHLSFDKYLKQDKRYRELKHPNS